MSARDSAKAKRAGSGAEEAEQRLLIILRKRNECTDSRKMNWVEILFTKLKMKEGEARPVRQLSRGCYFCRRKVSPSNQALSTSVRMGTAGRPRSW